MPTREHNKQRENSPENRMQCQNLKLKVRQKSAIYISVFLLELRSAGKVLYRNVLVSITIN